MVTRLGPTTPTAELAALLNAAGLTTGTGKPFDVKAVQWIRHAYHIPAPNPYTDNEISVTDAAHRLGCSASVIYDWIKTGKLAARRGSGNRLCIPWTEQTEAECRRRITESRHLNPGARRTPPPDTPDAPPCRCRLASSLRKTKPTKQLHHRPEHPNPRLQEGQYEKPVPIPRGRSLPTAERLRSLKATSPIRVTLVFRYRGPRRTGSCKAR